MKNIFVFLRFLAAAISLTFSIPSVAQRLPDFGDVKAGDVIQYSLKIPGKSESFEYQSPKPARQVFKSWWPGARNPTNSLHLKMAILRKNFALSTDKDALGHPPSNSLTVK
jgi:hypothetical protein